jgi:adenosine kinase
VSGSIAVDRIMSFSGKYSDHVRAEALDKLSVSIFLDKLVDTPGGVGANIAYSLGMLGEAPVLLGSVGTDARGYMERLAGHGVDVSRVHYSKLPTASFNVITDADENQVGGFYPGAMFDSESLSFEPFKDDDPICVVGPHDPAGMRRQVEECVRWSLRLCYDVGQQVSNLDAADLRAGVDAATMLVLNEYEMAGLSMKTGLTQAEITAKVPVVVTTLGKDGSVVEGKDVAEPVRAGIVKPAKVADPTGAGDAYRAGLLYGWQRGWDWLVCAQLGATVAAYALEHDGTQGHKFTFAEVSERYAAAFGNTLPNS